MIRTFCIIVKYWLLKEISAKSLGTWPSSPRVRPTYMALPMGNSVRERLQLVSLLSAPRAHSAHWRGRRRARQSVKSLSCEGPWVLLTSCDNILSRSSPERQATLTKRRARAQSPPDEDPVAGAPEAGEPLRGGWATHSWPDCVTVRWGTQPEDVLWTLQTEQ